MENSEILLNKAVSILESANIMPDLWEIGGGTVLSSYFDHRLSKDIDVFILDTQYLSMLSTRFNDDASEALDYMETGRFISLTFNEGKIDFIASPQITDFSPHKDLFYGHVLNLEHPVEIVCKKMYFRGDYALPRDIFDLAIVYTSHERENLINALKEMPDKVELFYNSLKRQLEIPDYHPYSVDSSSMLLPNGKIYSGKEFKICKELLAKINSNYKFIHKNASRGFSR